jgi:RHS repeat-associated protein
MHDNNQEENNKLSQGFGMNMMKNIQVHILLLLVLLVSAGSLQAENVVYYHNDALGSPVAATNSSGAVIWKEDYQPYGEKAVNDAAASSEKIGYTGQAFDKKTGLNYFGARYYDPVIGRFMGIDPVGFQEGNIHSFNRYAYANNNPYRYVDPDGAYPGLLHEDGTPLDVPTGSPVVELVGPPEPPGPERSTFDKVWDNYGWQVMGSLDAIPETRMGEAGIGVGLMAIGGVRKLSVAAKRLADPKTIRFSQDSIRGTFRDGRSVQDLAAGLKNGSIKAGDVPAIRTVERNGQLISIDNRRLAAFRDAGVPIRTRPATAQEILQAEKQGKFSAGASGGDTIRIRGQ